MMMSRLPTGRKRLLIIALIVGGALLLLVPTFASRFTVFILYLLFLNVALAQSWNLVGGYTGLISLGHAAFFGIGAYTAAIFMSTLQLPFLLAVIAGGLLAVVFAIIIAFPTFRFRVRSWRFPFKLRPLAVLSPLRLCVDFLEDV